ncbi:MAG: prolipoprotein diacylglyceryl transferase [Chloroflexi bacterium]|nr:prolipoprotein diacylglyceryl transferase [Chloroflexota bacterium]
MKLVMDGISLGPLIFHWSGLLIVFGIAAGLLLATLGAKVRNDDVEIIHDLFLPLIFWGTLGARLWHLLTPPLSSVELGLTTRYYFSHPLDSLALWTGGLGLPGALIGGLFALFLFARKNKLPFWALADLLAPGLALAQAIGRIGNYFNQELYGLPTNLPWKIFIEPAHRLIGYEAVENYHPLFAYEVLLNIANMALLLWLSRRFFDKLITGDLFLSYLGIYSFGRFFLEFLRIDAALVNGINVNQVFFAIAFVCAAVGLYLRRRLLQKL